MKRILVIGGTGAMGVYLVPLLAKNGYSVTPHTFATSAIIGILGGVKQNKAEKKSSSLPNSYDSFTFFTNQSPMVRCSASALCFNKKR